MHPDDFFEGAHRVRIEGRRLKHVLAVHRALVGDELCVGMLGDRIGIGKVTLLTQSALEMEVRFGHSPPPPLPLILILALPRPKVLRRLLRSASALGVKRIILINALRVEKSYWQTPFLNDESLKEQLVLGLEQTKDTVLPNVLLRPRFRPFVEDELPGLIKDTLPLVAHPAGAEPLPRDIRRSVTLAVGPEGGFIPYEIDKLAACGFKTVSLGERILNVETVIPFLIARLF